MGRTGEVLVRLVFECFLRFTSEALSLRDQNTSRYKEGYQLPNAVNPIRTHLREPEPGEATKV
jgi:hypothetical protein